jgi:hypothetical protein
MQSLNLRDDRILCRHALRIVARQGASNLLQVLKSYSNVEPVENWQFADAGIGENTPQAGTTISEGRQSGFFGPADGIETAADQNVDVRAGSGDGSKN